MGAEGPDQVGWVEVGHGLQAQLHALRQPGAVGGERHLAECLLPFGASLDVELTLVEDHVLLSRLEHVRGDLLRLVADLLGRLQDGQPAHRERPAAVGPVPECGPFGRVTVTQLDQPVGHPERVRDDLREGRVVALAVRVGADVDVHGAGGEHADVCRFGQRQPACRGRGGRAWADAADLDPGRDPDPQVPALGPGLLLVSPELLVAGDAERLL